MRHSNGQTATLPEIRNGALDGNTVLLEYLLGDRRSWLWYVSPDSIERFELPPRAVLERLARQLYTDITARDLRIPSETADQRAIRLKQADERAATEALRLREAILGPVWNRLGRHRVVLVNDGLLHLVPFGALGVQGEIVLAPSASVLLELRRNSAPLSHSGPILLLADPVFDTAKFARLSMSRSEANKIAALVPHGVADEKFGPQATTAVAHSPAFAHATAIHIASHTILNSDNPELSGIVLSQATGKENAENGFLRLRDIYALHLNAGLVTLSGCETALGKDVRGEGMIGLSYAFLYAGARRAVASLWKVEDAATEEFMTSFYTGIYRKGLTPAAALHAAQHEMRLDPRWRAPYYWASFTIEGDWN
jgi:CHAT domain-containing protein